MSIHPEPLRAFWCRTPSRPNFGDALTPWLIRRLHGCHPRFAWPEDPAPKFFVCGSIAALAGAGCTVWGAGVMHRDDRLSPQARFLAVRGPRTRARAIACGAECPPVLGDPALLLPRLLPVAPIAKRGVGFVAHYADQAHLDSSWIAARGWRLIDIQDDIEAVVEQVVQCEWIMSSSLHGLIVAHAYGVPAARVEWRPLPSGDGTKFADHYEALGMEAQPAVPLSLRGPASVPSIERMAWCPARLDTDALWRSCPFRVGSSP